MADALTTLHECSRNAKQNGIVVTVVSALALLFIGSITAYAYRLISPQTLYFLLGAALGYGLGWGRGLWHVGGSKVDFMNRYMRRAVARS